MIVRTPENQHYGSALVSGWALDGSSESQRMTVILKAAFDLVGAPGSVREMQAVDDPDRVEIVYQDQGQYRYEDSSGITHILEAGELLQVSSDENGDPVPDRFSVDKIGKSYFVLSGADVFVEDVIVAQDEKFEFDVQREADIALIKMRTDIAVEGYRAGTTSGAIVVNDETWMIRAASAPLHLDTSRNLFGYQPRLAEERAISVGTDFKPLPGNMLPSNYTNYFNNFHWRSDDFTTPLNLNLASLPSTGRIDIFRSADLSGNAYSFTLPDLDLSARYRFNDGILPDHEHCWRSTGIGPMHPDTLIVEPDDNRATILWRAGWAIDAQPLNAYRQVEVTRGGA